MTSCLLLRGLVPLLAACLACSPPAESSADGAVTEQQAGDPLATAVAADSVLRKALADIDAGHPWKATLAVSPRLGASRDYRPVLVAARAAAAWGGWAEVEKLLAGQLWIDTAAAGEGRVLLTRAALERDDEAAAIMHARTALRAASTPDRRVYLARALDRDNQTDSAAGHYREAARKLPVISDWLLLRAAGAERSSERREDLYDGVRSASAKARVPWTEAQALERFGDPAGAADRYDALKSRANALRLRHAAADSAGRIRIRAGILDMLRGNPTRDEARQAAEILEASGTPLTPAEELDVARALTTPGPLARVVQGFDRANRAGLLQPSDRLQYGLALSRAGRTRDAMSQLAMIDAPASLAAQAAYQRARLVMTSTGAGTAIPALRAVVTRFPNETETAAAALFLLADLTSDQGRYDAAIAAYRELYSKYPRSGRADDARLRAALLDFAHGRHRLAGARFDSLATGFPGSAERTAARYWAGRSWKAAGDRARANSVFQSIAEDQPTSYYGLVSSRQIGRDFFTVAGAVDTIPDVPEVVGAMRRVVLLRELGMDAEARFELDAMEEAATASSSGDLAIATAAAFRDHGEGARAIRLGNRIIEKGDRSPRAFRLAYPMIDREELERHARTYRLDAALVAGLIRQESSFKPDALSAANARGLMQVLPSVGAEIARSLRYPVWSPSLLYDPDVNLQIGSAHLAAGTRQYGNVVRVLAAYNAGGSRVDRWSRKPGVSDPELFAELIPYVETRDYVRIVQRNAEVYRALYFAK